MNFVLISRNIVFSFVDTVYVFHIHSNVSKEMQPENIFLLE